jgi:hypothetical protein
MYNAIRRALLIVGSPFVSRSNISVERDAPQAGFVRSLRAPHRQRWADWPDKNGMKAVAFTVFRLVEHTHTGCSDAFNGF